MRRTPYNNDKLEKTYLKNSATKYHELNNLSFRIDGKVQENNFIVPRTSHNYYHSKMVKPFTNRPLTTQKTHEYLDFKRQNQQREDTKDLFVSTKEHRRAESSYLDYSKGRVYRGGSWKYEQKIPKELGVSTTSRYPHKRQSISQFNENQRKSKKSGGLMDLIGQNLKKPVINNKQQDFFEYIMRFSYRTKKGYIPNNSSKVNQDNFIINPNINNRTWQHLFAVCDGHGPLGHHVSSFIKNNLPNCISSIKTLQRYPKEGIHKAFQNTYDKMLRESKIDMNFSGSTIICCYLQQNKLICANVGDSRAIIGRIKSNNKWEAVPLSTDHKPTIQKEAERIKKMKGRVEAFKDEYGESIGPLRVWVQHDSVPGLAMTRSFGDLVGASVGVSPIPEIKQFTLTEEDKIILIGSDGVFQFLQNQELINQLIPFYESKQIQQASDHIMSLANKSWTRNSSIIDDITFILIFISYNEI